MGKLFNTKTSSYHGLARFIRHRLALGILVNFFTGISALLVGVFIQANQLPYPVEAFIIIALVSMMGASAGGLLAIRLTSGSLKTIEQVEKSLEGMAKVGGIHPVRDTEPPMDPMSPEVAPKAIVEPLERLLNQMEASRTEQLELFARVAHDLRSPLAAIIGYAELLADPELSKDKDYIRKCREVILNEGHQVLELVDDFVSMIALQAGGEQTNRVSFHLAAFLEDLLREVKQTSGYDVLLENKAGDVIVSGDMLRLREAFLRIVEEAVKACSGMPAIQIALKPAQDPGFVEIPVVEFTGDQFDLSFWNTDDNQYLIHERKSEEKIDGSKLDLIASIIGKQGGKLNARAQEGSGPIFTICLPIAQASC